MKNFQQKGLDEEKKELKTKVPLLTEYMVAKSKLITIKADTPVMEALDILLNNRISGVPVVNEKGEVLGLFDDKDCLNIMVGGAYYNQPVQMETVSSYMSNVMKSISIDTDIINVSTIFLTTPYKRLLVMDNQGKLAGQISRRDILRAIKDMNS